MMPAGTGSADKRIVFVLKGYPRLSETFIAQEIHSLERLGLDIHIVAMRQPTDDKIHPVHQEIMAPVTYLPEYLHHEPFRVLRAMVRVARNGAMAKVFGLFLKDLRRDISRNRIRRFGQACVLTAEMPEAVDQLHAHFIHTPASVVRYTSLMTGLPWSCSAHAKDIWTSPDWDLADKLVHAEWAVTCTRIGSEHLSRLAPPTKPVTLSYHGIDLARFPALLTPRPLRDGSDGAHPVRLLTVARAVEKKGLDGLLMALAVLPPDLHWSWTHVGGGSLVGPLKAQAKTLSIAERCHFRGSLAQADVLALYQECDLFVLPCRIAADGDRDGLPNVLMEAASQGLAMISTAVSGVPEIIEDGVTGLLVPADDSTALQAAIMALAQSPTRRFHLGKAAQKRVRSEFNHDEAIQLLYQRFRTQQTLDTQPAELPSLS